MLGEELFMKDLAGVGLVDENNAAKFLACSPSLLRKWRMGKKEGPPVVHIGRLVRYSVASLEEFVNENTTGGPNA